MAFDPHEDEQRNAFMECVRGFHYFDKSKKNCLIRIFSKESSEKCKIYNNGIDAIESVLEWEKIRLKQVMIEYNSTRLFKGHRCSIDCSGHKAAEGVNLFGTATA